MSSLVDLTRVNGIATITLNRPETLNAFNPAMYQELSDKLTTVSADDAMRVGILTGAGRAFSSGADVRQRFEAEIKERDARKLTIVDQLPSFPSGITDLTQVRQPLIAAINGLAIGVGFNIALQCDIRIMDESAKIRLPFTALGQVPEAFSTYYLPRLIGLAKALELWYTSRYIEADEALEIGLINKIAPKGKVLSIAQEMAEQIAENAPMSLMLTKRLGYMGASGTLESARHNEIFAQDTARNSEDFREAIAAFTAKRKPEFRGA